MTVLHEITIPDTPKGTNIKRCKCIHCGKQMNNKDAFTVRADGYRKRHEYVPCNDVTPATED